MLSVYNYMAGGLALTGIVAYLAFQFAVVQTADGQLALTSAGAALYQSPLKWVVMLAPLGLVFYLSARISSMSVSAAQISFWVFAGLMGLSLSSVFLIYTGASITQTFFVTAIAFGGLSLYGYTTKRDLTAFGSFLVMGVIGLIVASLVNIFLQSSAMQFVISVLGCQEGDHGRAVALPRLHQHVHVPVAVPRQPPLISQRLKTRKPRWKHRGFLFLEEQASQASMTRSVRFSKTLST